MKIDAGQSPGESPAFPEDEGHSQGQEEPPEDGVGDRSMVLEQVIKAENQGNDIDVWDHRGQEEGPVNSFFEGQPAAGKPGYHVMGYGVHVTLHSTL